MKKPYLIAALVLLAGCSDVKVWPFGESSTPHSSTPANATEYRCDGNKRFFVRYLDNGANAWLIYPDREVSLTRTASGASSRYSNGVAVLEVTGMEATLKDGEKISYSGCKSSLQK